MSIVKSELLKQLSKTEITIEAQVGEEEKMFGSITSNDIHKALEEKGIAIDRSSILLESPLKSLGIFHIKIRFRQKRRKHSRTFPRLCPSGLPCALLLATCILTVATKR